MPPLTPSKTFSRSDLVRQYKLRHFLSEGAQGKVYLASVAEPFRMVAIKIISKITVRNFNMLLQEQRLLKKVKGHPFIMEMIDSFHDTENFYLVSVRSPTLHEFS